MEYEKNPCADKPDILLVDDDAKVLELLSQLMEALGFPYRCAINGRQAVQELAERQCDIVISDMIMPEMDGMELLHHIRQHHPGTDVIILTGFSDKYGYSEVVKAGAMDFIAKPFTIIELEAKLERVCRERTIIKKLEAAQKDLEQRVRERTAELQETNARLRDEIHERKQAEEEKVGLLRQLQQAQKMEAIGTLAGGIAHDFNNILGSILGYADMAREEAIEGSVQAKDLSKVLTAGYKARDLVKQILAFSRQAEMERIPLQPATVVKEALKMLRASIPTTIAIEQDVDPQCGVILADPIQIHQILMNLCTNGFHAMEESGGVLRVELQNARLGPEDFPHEDGFRPGAYVELIVRDTGAGIPADVREKIFDPYFTTKDVGKGTGMGLSISHGIIKSYGGVINVESTMGQGAAFHVYLPQVDQEPEGQVLTPGTVKGGKESILFVDDEDLLVNMGRDMLERLGYSVTACQSSTEALQLFEQHSSSFDLVITDQTMPHMTGVEMAQAMLKIRPEIPIILCTGYSASISEAEAKELGIREYALKPLVKVEVDRLIRSLLNNAGGS